MIYTKTIAGRQVFSDCKTIQLEFDHPPLVAVQFVSNPSEELILSDGWEVYNPPEPPTPVPPPATEPNSYEVMESVKKMLANDVESLSDEDALAVAALFPTWMSKVKAGEPVDTGERVWDDERLWKVLQPHTPMLNWRPADSPSLYVQVTIEQFPEWKQPTGATDAYDLGAHVSHNGHHWESTIPANTYEPGVYGWNQLD